MSDGVVFLPSFHESIKDLPDAERLGAYDAIIRYGLSGEVGDMTPLVKSLFVLIKPIPSLEEYVTEGPRITPA